MEQQPTMIAVIGKPGSGKTTLARGIATHTDYLGRAAHISLGQEVRDIRDGVRPSPTTRDIERHFNSDDPFRLLRDDIIDQIAIDALMRYRNTPLDLLVVDGMPRTPSQMDDLLRDCAGFDYRFGGVIHTTIEPHTALARLIKRKRSPEGEQLSELDAKHRLDMYDIHSASIPSGLRHRGIVVADVWTGDAKEISLGRALPHVKFMTQSPTPTNEAA